MGPISSSLRPEADGRWVRYEDFAAAEARAEEEREIRLGREDDLQGLRRAIQEVEEELGRRAASKDMMHAARAGDSDYAAVCQGKAEGARAALGLLRSKLNGAESHGGDEELAKKRSDKPCPLDQIGGSGG